MVQEIGKTRSGLRFGYTTGSCAAAGAKASAYMLLSGEEIRHVKLMTPKGIELYLDIESIERKRDSVTCSIRKFSGDDPDVTDGIEIVAKVQKLTEDGVSPDIRLDGGIGVGRVTKPGVEQKIGEAAINKVPRKMIREAVLDVCTQYSYTGQLQVTISVPEGSELAKKTFNPRLGIEGGISILGTTGIVEPMSEKALTDTIFLEMKMLRETGHRSCYVVPGNYGIDFLKKHLGINEELAVKCSNYVGEAIEDAKILDMKEILFIGHIGKFVKLAAGVMNTHSRQADCRMEILAVHGAMAGASQETVCKIMECINTTEAIQILKEQHLLRPAMKTITERVEFYLQQRAGDNLRIGAILFSNEEGILGKTSFVDELLKRIGDEAKELDK